MPPTISYPALRAVHLGRFQRDAGAFSQLEALTGTRAAQASLILSVKPTFVVEVVRRLMLTPHGDGSLVEWMQIELPLQHIAEARCDRSISRVVLHLWKGPARVRLGVGHSKQTTWYEATPEISTSLPDHILPEGSLERDVLTTSTIVLDFEADSDDVDRLLNVGQKELSRVTKVYVHGTRRGSPQEDSGPPSKRRHGADDNSAASQQIQPVADAQRCVAPTVQCQEAQHRQAACSDGTRRTIRSEASAQGRRALLSPIHHAPESGGRGDGPHQSSRSSDSTTCSSHQQQLADDGVLRASAVAAVSAPAYKAYAHCTM